MINRMIYILCAFLLPVLAYPNIEKNRPTNSIIEEFPLTKSEKADITKFLKQSNASGNFDLNVILKSAYEGNPIAMYILGQCSLGGSGGTTINKDAANLHFKMAASLGYPPALYEIFQLYATEKQDPLLALVYLNLVISQGHKEYRELYYQQTESLAKLAGPKVVQEIERIALEKIIKVSKILQDIDKRKNEYNPAISLMSDNLLSNDITYSSEHYWKPFFESEQKWKSFFHDTP